jgi:hypothetical protein
MFFICMGVGMATKIIFILRTEGFISFFTQKPGFGIFILRVKDL